MFSILLATAIQIQSSEAAQGAWSLLPKRPYGLPVELTAHGAYLLARSEGEKDTIPFQIRSLADLELRVEGNFAACDFAGRYSICGALTTEKNVRDFREKLKFLDADQLGRERIVEGLSQAIDSAKSLLGIPTEVEFRSGGVSGPGGDDASLRPIRAVMSETGVGVLALDYDGRILVFRTRKLDLGDGDTTRVWRFAGSLCSKDPSGRDSACRLRSGSRFALDRILGGVVYAVETKEGACSAGWRSPDYGATWLPSIVIDQAVNDQPDSFQVAVERDCDSDGSRSNLVATQDRGQTWNRIPGVPGNDFRILDRAVVDHRLSGSNYSIRSSGDLGKNWIVGAMGNWERPVYSAVLTGQGDIFASREDGSALRTHSSRLPFGDEVWLSIRQRSVRKARIRGSEVFVLQGKSLADSKLLRLHKGQWRVIREGIQDFEVVGNRVIVVGDREGGLSKAPTETRVYDFQRRVVGSEDLLVWDSVFTQKDSLRRVIAGQFIDRISRLSDGSLQLAFQSFDENDGGRKVPSFYRSTDQGRFWKHSQESSDTVASIDSVHFRLDGKSQLWGRDLPDEVGLRGKGNRAAMVVQGGFLKIRLADPVDVQVDFVSPSGRIEPVRTLALLGQGEHSIALPGRRSVGFVRVRFGDRSEILTVTPLWKE